ncbi:MAG TPA: helix-turn-helix domain-containing protein [Methylibium sp.]|nr:helix-turn-helix domain-containing protein [Methylibium sp.]
MATLQRERRLAPPDMTPEEAEMARLAQRFIVESLDHSRAAVITLTSDTGDAPSVSVPTKTLRFIADVLGALSERQPVVFMPPRREMSTVEAANFLNVSRPFVIKEIEAGRLPHRKVGSHRRIAFEDLMRYASEMHARQREALQRLADNAAELGLDY